MKKILMIGEHSTKKITSHQKVAAAVLKYCNIAHKQCNGTQK
jgi:ethanolamine utilization protein EutP (predicted NTPase)